MDIYDMCCADLWTNLDKVFAIEYINRLISFRSLCGPMDSTNQLTSVTMVERIYSPSQITIRFIFSKCIALLRI